MKNMVRGAAVLSNLNYFGRQEKVGLISSNSELLALNGLIVI